MYKKLILFLPVLLLIACTSNPQKETPDNPAPEYPDDLKKVLEAHGGIEQWKAQRILNFVIDGDEETAEVHTVDLHTRQSRIETSNYILGNDGKSIWLAQDSAYFTKSPVFYHNLMFYFFAMPFVLADPGIQYAEAEPATFLDKTYPGLRISYEANIGDAPEDEYILYYDPDTYQMQWLAYTVTFFDQEKSDRFRIIHYDEWETVDGFLLPKSMQWYAYDNGTLGEAKYRKTFSSIKVSEVDVTDDLWTAPPNVLLDTVIVRE